MATALVESMQDLSLHAAEEQRSEPCPVVQFKVSGLDSFELELDLSTAVSDLKKMATEACGIEPEHMRLLYKDRLLKDSDTLEACDVDSDVPVQVMFTAGHTALDGGMPRLARVQNNPFATPVRGLSGSKGDRMSRVSGRRGGMGLIRKYGIMMKRQEFREKAPEIGFVKYR